MKLKIAYLGSPEFSADFLEKILIDKELKKNVSVEFIVTQPDKPAGRKQILTSTPVKKTALKYNLKIIETEKSKIKDLYFLNDLKRKISQLDLAFIYAFSLIIPKELLNLPKYGFWCFHPSLLPKHRGPSPIVFSLLCGDKKTGGTIFKIDEKIDNGPIIAQKSLTIKNSDYRIDLEKKLTSLGFQLFKKTIKQLIVSKNINLKYQNNNSATFTRILKKEDGYIKYQILEKIANNKKINFEELPEIIRENNKNNKKTNPHLLIFNFFRALYPWPGVWTILPNNKRLKIIEMKLDFKKDTNNYHTLITKVQLEGKKPVKLEIFKKSYGFL